MKKAALVSKMASLMQPQTPPKLVPEDSQEEDWMDVVVEGDAMVEEIKEIEGNLSEWGSEEGQQQKTK